jgi:hypothetical protein
MERGLDRPEPYTTLLVADALAYHNLRMPSIPVQYG